MLVLVVVVVAALGNCHQQRASICSCLRIDLQRDTITALHCIVLYYIVLSLCCLMCDEQVRNLQANCTAKVQLM